MNTIASKVSHLEITNILQQLYASISAYEITDIYLKNILGDKSIREVMPKVFPYTYYNVNYRMFASKKNDYENYIYTNCIVNLIVCVENYCYEVLERCFILDKDAFIKEEASTTFKELALYMKEYDTRVALVKILVERKLRNEKTINMLKKISDYAKCGCYQSMETNQIKKINIYSLIRNCIIHNQSRVSKDLYDVAKDQFGLLNCNIIVNHKMCVDLSQAILDFISTFDARYSNTIIKDYDAMAFIKQYFTMTGEINPRVYKKMIYEKLSFKVKTDVVNKAIADKKNNIDDPAFEQVSSKVIRLIKEWNLVTCA